MTTIQDLRAAFRARQKVTRHCTRHLTFPTMRASPRALFNTRHARLLALLAALGMAAADLAWFPAKTTRAIAVAGARTCVATSRVWSTALCLTDTVYSLRDLTINLWGAVFTTVLAVVSTGEGGSAYSRTWVIILKGKFAATNFHSVLAILHDYFDSDSA